MRVQISVLTGKSRQQHNMPIEHTVMGLRAGMKFHYRKLTFWNAGSPEWNFIIESSHFEKWARLNEISLSKAHILKSRLAWMKFRYRKLTFWKAGSPDWNFIIESSHFEKRAPAPEWIFHYRKLTWKVLWSFHDYILRWNKGNSTIFSKVKIVWSWGTKLYFPELILSFYQFSLFIQFELNFYR